MEEGGRGGGGGTTYLFGEGFLKIKRLLYVPISPGEEKRPAMN